MDRREIHSRLLALLETIAPDIEPTQIDPTRNLRDQFDFDSMDALHFATAISETFHIGISETDTAQLRSLEAAERFVERRLATPNAK